MKTKMLRSSQLSVFVVALVFLAAPALANFPGAQSTVFGTTVDRAPACEATKLDDESRALLSLWLELEKKRLAGTQTPAEYEKGKNLYLTDQCGLMKGGQWVTIIQLDGHDYLGKLLNGTTLIFKSSGFERDDGVH